jgi:hypothetical protein
MDVVIAIAVIIILALLVVMAVWSWRASHKNGDD